MTDWKGLLQRRVPPAQVEALASALNRWADEATRIAPRLRVPATSVIDATLRAIDAGIALDRVFGVDLCLALAVDSHDESAIEHVVGRMLPAALLAARKVDRSETFLDELRSLVSERLFKKSEQGQTRFAQFTGQGPLGAWLRATVVRQALTLKRSGAALPDDDEGSEATGALADVTPELRVLDTQYRAVFRQAFEAVITTLEPSDQLLLKLYYVDGLSMEAIGKFQGRNKSNVSRALERLHHQVLSETRERLGAVTGAGDAELDSLMDSAPSYLSLNLPVMLGRDEP
jgi:RNA polymerase sigma-70 factor, ECF subfamily